MAEDGELSTFPWETVRILVSFTSVLKPTVEWWSVSLLFSMTVGLTILGIGMQIAANRFLHVLRS